MRARQELIAFLRGFPGQEAGDLDTLDEVVAEAVSLPPDPELDAALFSVFERHPDEDGYGVYWSILHGLEARGAYEPALLACVRRKPSEFAARMLNGMCNAGHKDCAGVAILHLLTEIAGSPDASEETRRSAAAYVEHQRQRSAGD
jgi:hypothetical protein